MLTNIIFVMLLNLLTPTTSNRVSYAITEKSSLTLSGSSNVNKFACKTYDNISDGSILIETNDRGNTVSFSNAVLRIKIKSFDCKNPLITKDFYHNLDADNNPNIDVELLHAIPVSGGKILKSSKGRFKADVAISLNGMSRLDEIIVHWQRVEENLYRFTGSKKLQMSDYGIDSPVAALGIIKVRDDIFISFDLYIKAN